MDKIKETVKNESPSSVMPWVDLTTLPEECGVPEESTYHFSFIRVLITGKFSESGEVFVDVAMRIKGKETGNPVIDECTKTIVPIDGRWHWRTGMKIILAWCPLPDIKDPRWIPCTETLPEQAVKKHSFGRMEAISVMTLCRREESEMPEVCLANRYKIEESLHDPEKDFVKNEWVWSKLAQNAIAWMPFPAAYMPAHKNR